MMEKPRIICFTKTDAVFDETKERIREIKTDEEIILISALTGYNLDELKDKIWEKLKKEKEENE